MFHCAYQGGGTLLFGKGTMVSVSSSKYLIATDDNACIYQIACITQMTTCLLII